MSDKKLRALAVVLPQFHPIAENDAWWGKGFTEWTNVAKTTPRFEGHYQPHLPSDLGFYDMRLQQTLADQAQLAQQFGIYGFCYYHYWFNGQRLLEKPINTILKSQTPDFPFMVCWANENWSRRWDGQDQEILIEQKYSLEDHRQHAKYLCENEFKDPRYIRIDNKIFFLFYKAQIIPDLKEALKIWREEAAKHDMELYLGAVKTQSGILENAIEDGFDIVCDWQPDWQKLQGQPDLVNRIKNKFDLGSTYRKIGYNQVVAQMTSGQIPDYKHFNCVVPGWDNSARKRQNAFLMHNSTPELYQQWLEKTCERSQVYSKEENFVFINAWNEWAEGNHLEPDHKWGTAYLASTKKVLAKYA